MGGGSVAFSHEGVGSHPNFGRAPLGTLSRCAVLETKDYIIIFGGVLLRLFGLWRTTSLARLDDLELALEDNFGSRRDV